MCHGKYRLTRAWGVSGTSESIEGEDLVELLLERVEVFNHELGTETAATVDGVRGIEIDDLPYTAKLFI